MFRVFIMKEIEFDLKNNPFYNFLSSRYSMSARLNVEKMWNYSKENDLSFFTLSLAALINSLNEIPEMRRRIVNGKVIEYDYLDAVCPIMDEDSGIYKEMRVKAPQRFDEILDWHDYVQEHERKILNGTEDAFEVKTTERDELNIANFSCIPWVDFDSITNCTASSNQIQPLITWGKVNEDYEMTVAITVSHIFVNGRELAYFYQFAQDNFNNLF